jgi:hypothetical protein
MAEDTKKDDAKGKAPRHRSPAYPAISLRKALERAREFYKIQKHHAAPVKGAVDVWGFKPKSSGGLQTISALKQYGMMSESGEGDSRHVQLTETALAVIRDDRQPSPDRDEVIRKAALLPKIHAEMWKKWDGELPAESTVRFFLVQEKKYNEASVGDLIASYKDTVAFAKLVESDKTLPSEGRSKEPDGEINIPPNPPPPLGGKLMEGERVVFTHEVEPQHGVRIVASGAVDQELVEAVEMFLTLQKKRLGLDKKPTQ